MGKKQQRVEVKPVFYYTYLFLVQLYITILLSLALDDRLIIKRKFRENDGQSWDSLIFYTLADYFYVNGKLTKIAFETHEEAGTGGETRPAFTTKSQILSILPTTYLLPYPFFEILVSTFVGKRCTLTSPYVRDFHLFSNAMKTNQ